MDTNKLLKAIQILVREEIKEQLPSIIKEAVKSELKTILAEQNNKPKKQVSNLSMAKSILGEETSKIQVKEETFSKNPMINQILNETRASSMDKTINFNNPNIAAAGLGALRAEMASKMGYSDLMGGAQPTGLGVETGNEALDKAFNRDYSELVKRFNKK